jgi:hypothetical protein
MEHSRRLVTATFMHEVMHMPCVFPTLFPRIVHDWCDGNQTFGGARMAASSNDNISSSDVIGLGGIGAVHVSAPDIVAPD